MYAFQIFYIYKAKVKILEDMESSSGEAADQKDALRDKLEEAKQQAEVLQL